MTFALDWKRAQAARLSQWLAAHLLCPIGVALALALTSSVAMPVPGLPAPLTLQTLLIGIAGALVGWRHSTIGVLFWIFMGAAGLPAFSGAAGGLGILFSARGGYLLAMPAAAAITCQLRQCRWPEVVIFLMGSATVLLGGTLACAFLTGLEQAVTLGLLPYLGVETVKAVVGHFTLLAWRACRSRQGGRKASGSSGAR